MSIYHVKEENYHIYNRGAHKEPIFREPADYDRFIALLYVANSTDKIRPGWSKNVNLWNTVQTNPLVEIFCYCLMPNHFHIGIREIRDDGISKFMHKLCTSYSMYFNIKYKHSGTIIQGGYKWKHIDSDDYYRFVVEYIHLNPYGIEEPDIDRYAKWEYKSEMIAISKEYNYSSYKDYLGIIRPQNKIIEVRPR